MRSVLLAIFTALNIVGAIFCITALVQAATPQVPDSSHESIFIMRGVENGKGWAGTGFIFKAPSGRKFIITNHHICTGGGLKAVEALGIEVDPVAIVFAKVLAASSRADLCAVALPKFLDHQRAYSLAPSAPKLKDHVITVGHPRAGALARSEGELIKYEMSEEDTLQLPHIRFETFINDAPIQPGNSGSPVFNKKDEVIGVAFAHNTLDGTSYAVSWQELKDFVGQVEKEYP